MTGDVDPQCARKVHLLLVSFLVCIIAVCRQSTIALCNLSLSTVGSVCSCILHRFYLTGWVSIVRGWGELSGVRVSQSTLGQLPRQPCHVRQMPGLPFVPYTCPSADRWLHMRRVAVIVKVLYGPMKLCMYLHGTTERDEPWTCECTTES